MECRMGGRRRYLSLDECLQRAFLNPDYVDPMAERQIWAVIEGVNRLNPYEWAITDARKKHECIRGCEIKANGIYFKRAIGRGWGSDWKICAGCMAMILHFKEVDKLPTYMFSHWDFEAEKPVNMEEEQ